jgi:hypothetical protein
MTTRALALSNELFYWGWFRLLARALGEHTRPWADLVALIEHHQADAERWGEEAQLLGPPKLTLNMKKVDQARLMMLKAKLVFDKSSARDAPQLALTLHGRLLNVLCGVAPPDNPFIYDITQRWALYNALLHVNHTLIASVLRSWPSDGLLHRDKWEQLAEHLEHLGLAPKPPTRRISTSLIYPIMAPLQELGWVSATLQGLAVNAYKLTPRGSSARDVLLHDTKDDWTTHLRAAVFLGAEGGDLAPTDPRRIADAFADLMHAWPETLNTRAEAGDNTCETPADILCSYLQAMLIKRDGISAARIEPASLLDALSLLKARGVQISRHAPTHITEAELIRWPLTTQQPPSPHRRQAPRLR